ncbi:paraneoplastic antigen-like protein 8B [Nycticebus coucang]|uniref:paraneoplastic antigen-like protein 8B n=1 Tax=Nycticebus coucang TaxID=9470 RepID=UPI00234CFCC0|nr:paraneoplastic antigen-like protein 8B [Nycticebus coucang]
MALSLLQDWCRELNVDVHKALLVTGIPEGLEQVDIEAVLQPNFLPLGTFKLRNVRAMRTEKAKAALVEFVEDTNHATIPREIPGTDGVWKVLCMERAQDARVLRQMERLLLDERVPGEMPTPAALETQAQGSGQAGRPSGAARNARRGRRGRRNRARGNRLTRKGTKRGRGGRPSTSAGSESEDSSDESLGIVIREIQEGDLSGDEDQSALYATLQAAAKELIKKWALQSTEDEEDGPREFLALVTVTDKAKKEKVVKETPEAESIIKDKAGVPDLVALLAVRDTSDEELPTDGEASESDSQDNEDQEKEEMDNPEFVAIVAYTDPSDPWAQEEMLKIASVIEALGWSDEKDEKDALPQVLSVMSKDTSGTRVKVEAAGREVDAMVLRKAQDDGNLLECISTLAREEEPEISSKGKKAPRGLLGGWGEDGEDEGGLLELVALLAAQDMAEVMKEEKPNPWEGERYKYAKGKLGEVLALLAAREKELEEASDEASEEESEEAESAESEPEDAASRKPLTKKARTAPRGPAQAGAATVAAPVQSRAQKTRGVGRGRGVTPEKKAGSRPSAKEDAAGSKKKKGGAGAGAQGQPPASSKSVRGRKARRGQKLRAKCR